MIELPKVATTPSKWQDLDMADILEFHGDNLMYSCISEAVLKMLPFERTAKVYAVSAWSPRC